MKFPLKSLIPSRRASCALLLGALTLWLPPTRLLAASQPEKTDTAKSSEADQAWAELLKAKRPPMPPAEWRTNHPSDEQIKAFEEQKKKLIETAISKAKDFQTRYPDDPRAAQAAQTETNLTRIAAVLAQERGAVAMSRVKTGSESSEVDSEEAKFQRRMRELQAAAVAKQSEGRPAMLAAYDKAARQLIKEFPEQEQAYQLLLAVASATGPEELRKVAEELKDNPKAGRAADRAKQLLGRLDAVGKPVDIKFTAVDGREVNLADLKGKVVLVDFWATWCGPCVAELPHVKEAYEKLHSKGFEIVGVSLDQDKNALLRFTKNKEMPWPQYFDGKGWQNQIASRFGIDSIPAMWLVDKKGVLRDTNARGDLAGKVEKLLNE